MVKIIYTVTTYGEFRHLRNTIFFLAEITQSVFLTAVLATCFILHFRDFGEIVPSGPQAFTVTLIWAAIITEYLLMFANIIVVVIIPMFCMPKTKSAKEKHPMIYYLTKENEKSIDSNLTGALN